jgi:cytochrome b6-f complex iron-sulfur subunit
MSETLDPKPAPDVPLDKGRRRSLYLLGGIGVGWLLAALYPVFKYISPRPALDPFGEEGRAAVKKVTPADVAGLGTGANGSYGQRGCLILRTDSGELRAFDAKCTHAGCNVNFSGDKILCHCHGGVYNLQGKNVAGPPPRPLTPLKVFEENGIIYVAPTEPTTNV